MPEIQAPTPVMCSNCGSQLGEEIHINDITLVHAGGGIYHELSGHCAQCNAPFYWSTKGTLIQRMIMSYSKTYPRIRTGGG